MSFSRMITITGAGDNCGDCPFQVCDGLEEPLCPIYNESLYGKRCAECLADEKAAPVMRNYAVEISGVAAKLMDIMKAAYQDAERLKETKE